MKKIIVILIVFISVYTFGQNKYDFYLVIDKYVIQIDTIRFDTVSHSLDPKWIKKMEVIRDKNQNLHGNGGKIYIYPKKKFKKKLLEEYKRD